MHKEGNLIFLGTGSSDGIPRVSCLTNPNKICKVCESATMSTRFSWSQDVIKEDLVKK